MKRMAIDKANATMVIIVGIAAFICVFCLVSSKALLGQQSYQNEVISKRKDALKQLDENIKVAEQLTTSYKAFAEKPQNILKGNAKPTSQPGDKDGENARIILDALPSKYDFPALATSMQKLFQQNNFAITSFNGVDDEISQSAKKSSNAPAPEEIPFTVTLKVPVASGKDLMLVFERCIRPLQIDTLKITGGKDELEVSVGAKTYFQPEKNLEIKKEIVK